MPDKPTDIRRHLFLTGEKQVGKSTLLRRLIAENSLCCCGFETQALYLGGERKGFTLHGLVDMPPYENDCIVSARIGEKRSVPVLPVFNENGAAILKGSIAAQQPFILMDELGKLELDADDFIAQVFACLDSGKHVIGVLQKCSAPHVQAIMARSDVTVITVTRENRDTLFEQLAQIDWL